MRVRRPAYWAVLALRDEMQSEPAHGTWRRGWRRLLAANTRADGERHEAALDRVGIQARLFGVGGLIQAAVGLSGGVGGLLTKRSGLARNAWSRMC